MTNNQELIARARDVARYRTYGAVDEVLDELADALDAATYRAGRLEQTVSDLADAISEIAVINQTQDGFAKTASIRSVIAHVTGNVWAGNEPEDPHSLDHMFGDIPAQLAALTIRREVDSRAE